MDFEFSPDALMLRDMLRRFLEKEIRPLERNYVSRGFLEPVEQARVQRAIEQMGLWGITVPEKWGGGELDLITSCLLDEELGKTFIPVEIGEVPPLLYACRGPQIKDYLEPALAGERKVWLGLREPGATLPEKWTTRAIQQDGSYILNGRKLLVGIPDPQDFFVIFVGLSTGVTAFILDANQEGIKILSNPDVILSLENCPAPVESILGEEGLAFSLGADLAPQFWIRTGARYVGLADRLVEIAAEYAKDWVALGEPLEAKPAVQRMLADMIVKIEGTRWMVYHAAWSGDTGKPLQLLAAEVRLSAFEMLQSVIDYSSMIFGGPGPTLAIEVNRLAQSPVPIDAMEIALKSARSIIAGELLMTGIGSEA
jgi:alkylation response protein AidB-like acyl-CoA dehydrogenase